jgi:hypothetical protein
VPLSVTLSPKYCILVFVQICRVLTIVFHSFVVLQIQRSLQLRIEEQGKCLQMMLEQHSIPVTNTDKVLDDSTSVEGSKLSSDVPESSTAKEVSENCQNGLTKQTGKKYI